MATTADVARVARQAGEAGDRGFVGVIINGIDFDLDERGWCAKFVRQVFEAATGCGERQWPYSARNAKLMEAKLKADDLAVLNPVAGDIIAINRSSGIFGHIGVYLGDGWFAENTSSTSRGPGTTISPVSAVASRVTGYYRAVPLADTLKVVLLPGDALIPCGAEVEDGATRCDLRPLAEALGATVHDRIGDQGKVYVRKGAD